MRPRVVVVQVKLVTNESTEDLKEHARKFYTRNYQYIKFKNGKKGKKSKKVKASSIHKVIDVETQVKQVMTFIHKD